MPTLAEQWMERGRAEGLQEAIADERDGRFGAEARSLIDDVRAVTDANALRAVLRAVTRSTSIDAARRAVRGA